MFRNAEGLPTKDNGNMPTQFNTVAIDVETTRGTKKDLKMGGSHPWYGARMFSIALYLNSKAIFARNDSHHEWIDYPIIRKILEDPNIHKVFHNAKFDLTHLQAAGFTVKGYIWDTELLAYLVDGTRVIRKKLNLEACVNDFLPSKYRKLSDEIALWFKENGYGNKNTGKWDFTKLPPTLLKKYNIADAKCTFLLFFRLFPLVYKRIPILLDYEHRLIPCLMKAERIGMAINYSQLNTQYEVIEQCYEDFCYMAECLTDLEPFNINKYDHQIIYLRRVGAAHFLTKKTNKSKKYEQKHGVPKYSLTSSILQGIDHHGVHDFLVAKKANTLLTKFIVKIFRYHVDRVIHSETRQDGTWTGRMSVINPPMQQLPKEGQSIDDLQAAKLKAASGYDLNNQIRQIFQPSFPNRRYERRLFVCSDKDRFELAILAHYSDDTKLVNAIKQRQDLHQVTGNIINAVAFKNALDPQLARKFGKTINFAILYGAGNAKIATQLNTSESQVVKIKQAFFKEIPSLRHWLNGLEHKINHEGYVVTDHGRIHRLSTNDAYKAASGMIQGTAGDEVKTRMVDIYEYFEKHGYGDDAYIVLNIHDELVINIPEHLKVELLPVIYNLMHKTSISFRVPLYAGIKISERSLGSVQELSRDQIREIFNARKKLCNKSE